MKIGNFDTLAFDDELEAEIEIIPLRTSIADDDIQGEIPKELSILPLKNTVLLPGVAIPIVTTRESTIKLVNDAKKSGNIIGVVAQLKERVEEVTADDIYKIGTVAKIIKAIKLPDGNFTIFVEGQQRFAIDEVIASEPYFRARVHALSEDNFSPETIAFEATISEIRSVATQIIRNSPNLPADFSKLIAKIDSDAYLVNFITSTLHLPLAQKQEILEENTLAHKAEKLAKYVNDELQRVQILKDIHNKVRVDLDKQQRDYILHQQIKSIQEELGAPSQEAEIEEMRKRGKEKKWNAKTAEIFEKELLKLQRMNTQSSDYTVQRGYIEFLLELPWGEYSKDSFNISKAKKILDADHYGLEEVKKRILEHLAVLKLRGDMKSPILCLYGAPGVGKTSLGKSVAKALGREYVRMSLGGLHDEAEIRGHRKTYIGAMAGRVLQLIKKAGKSNPVFVLDEIDKLGNSYHGDPSSAMLEVLDPEQNSEFYDNFLETGYDLSKVLFIATANDLSTIQPALRDRMEIINVSGYTIEEKIEIAKKHLLPKLTEQHGLKNSHFSLTEKEIAYVVEGYTRESGVRGLEKQLSKVVRYVAKCVAMQEKYIKKITTEKLTEVLGHPKMERDKYENNDTAGVVTGLAWTSVGGDILFIESAISKGKGALSITGNLGQVMKESATIALEYIKANAQGLKIDNRLFEQYNIHIHVPEGATPKDGPSAGIALLTSLMSLLTQRRVKANIAMTGEITLRGKVLPVGGIKEKVLAAKRAGINEIILCRENKPDVEEIKADYLHGLSFHYVTTMEEVIAIALTKQKVKNAKSFTFEASNANK